MHRPRPQIRPRFAFTAGRLWDEAKDIATIERATALIEGPVLAAGPLEGPNGARIDLTRIKTLGPLSGTEVASWLSGAPIFLSMARYEPFGLAVLEAAQAGCPLVLADTPVFRELWRDAAVFVPPGDAPRLARAVNALIADPAGCARLGEAARKRAALYGADRMGRAMAAIYERLLAAPSLPRPTQSLPGNERRGA